MKVIACKECSSIKKWKNEFQGKYIFSKVCSDILKADMIQIRSAYVDIALKEKAEIFKDIVEIFEGFNMHLNA